MAKVRLLGDGGYKGFENVKFPVVVEADTVNSTTAQVSGSELLELGVDRRFFLLGFYSFLIGAECEVV